MAIERGVKMAAVLAIVLLFVEKSNQVNEIYYENNKEAYDSLYRYKDILNSTINPEVFRASKYERPGVGFRFIKDLSSNIEDSPNTTDIIVEEEAVNTRIYSTDNILVCFYKEVKNKGFIEKEFVSRPDNSFRPCKSILIPMNTMYAKEIHNRRIEESKKIRDSSNNLNSIKNPLQFLTRVLNVHMCRSYIKWAEGYAKVRSKKTVFVEKEDILNNFNILLWLERHGEELLDDATYIYNFYYEIGNQYERCERYINFFTEELDFPLVTKILDKAKVPILRKYQSKNIERLEREFIRENNLIISKIDGIRKKCAKYIKHSISKSPAKKKILLEEAKEKVKKCIGILADGEILERPDNNVGSSYYFHLRSVKKRAARWNIDLLDTLLDCLYKYESFEGDSKELVKLIKDENKKIIYEARKNERKSHFLLSFYANGISSAFKEINKKIVERLAEQYNSNLVKYIGTHKPRSQVSEEIKEICSSMVDILVGINLSISCLKKKDVSKHIKNQINTLVDSIEMEYENNTSIKEKSIALGEYKQKMEDLMFSAIIDKQLLSSTYEDIVVVRKAFRVIIDNVANSVFCKHDEIVDHINSSNIKLLVAEEEKYITEHPNIFKMINSLIEFANKYMYDSYERYLFKEMKVNIDDKDVAKKLLDKRNAYSIFQILENISQVYRYISNLTTYDEIWNNSAILYMKNYSQSRGTKRARISDAYILYKSERDAKIYTKVIDFTDSTIKDFRKAKTSDDIEKIEGETIEFVPE